MYLIERLWIDTMENRNAYGFEAIGIVESIEEAERISNLEQIPKSQHPWPLQYADEFKGNTVPRFRTIKMPNLNNMTISMLKYMPKGVVFDKSERCKN